MKVLSAKPRNYEYRLIYYFLTDELFSQPFIITLRYDSIQKLYMNTN